MCMSTGFCPGHVWLLNTQIFIECSSCFQAPCKALGDMATEILPPWCPLFRMWALIEPMVTVSNNCTWVLFRTGPWLSWKPFSKHLQLYLLSLPYLFPLFLFSEMTKQSAFYLFILPNPPIGTSRPAFEGEVGRLEAAWLIFPAKLKFGGRVLTRDAGDFLRKPGYGPELERKI